MKNGTFYFVNKLYERNEINDNDLLNIAFRNNDGYLYNSEGEELLFIPEGIIPVTDINEDIQKLILSDYYDLLMEDDYFANIELKMSDIIISVYCGIYNGYYAMRFQDIKNLTAISGEENIGGLKFIYPYEGGNTVVLWKMNTQ